MRFKRKIVSMAVALAMAATMTIPAAVNADTTWTAPTTPLTVSNKIVKVGAHAAASTAVSYLGGNMVAERASDYRTITSATGEQAQYAAAKAFTKLGVFGTSINDDPDPYLWNYLYNKGIAAGNTGSKVDDEVYLSTVGSPMVSDTTVVSNLGTSYTLARRPEVLMDTKGGYDELIAKLPENTDAYASNDYDPISFTYQMNNLSSFVNDMYNLSGAIIQSGKKGRYDTANYNTYDIAQKYEAYIKGMQLYVMSEIDKGNIKKKTVALIDPNGIDAEGNNAAESGKTPVKYECVDSTMSSGTAASCRGPEYCENTTNNIIDTQGLTKASDGHYYATPEQICKADDIMTGVQAKVSTTEAKMKQQLVDAGIAASKIPQIHAVDPEGIFGIRMNSVENIFGIPVYQGFIYPEAVNPVYGSMYLYQNFWHVSGKANLISLANANFAEASLPEGIEADGTGYSESAIQDKINQGLRYYANNKSKFKGTKLELTDNIDVSGYLDKKNISASTTAAVADKAYTGKAITPSIIVKVDGKTLTKGTDYQTAYSNNVKTGLAKIVITGIGSYTGSKTVTFKIVPKKESLSSAKSTKAGRATVKWKQDTLASGYQIKAATNKKMTKNRKTVTVKSSKVKAKTLTKMKKGKTYYVKVRAYKTINKHKAYGAWSKVKKVKIRK